MQKTSLTKPRLAFILATLLGVGLACDASALDITLNPYASGSDIQNAINQVSASGGGTVNLSVGTYNIDASLNAKSNVTVNGRGQGSTIIRARNMTSDMLTSGGAATLTNFKLQNTTMDGDSKGGQGSSITQYNSGAYTNISIVNNEFKNCTQGCGMSIINGFTIQNNNMHDNGLVNGNGTANQNMYIRSCDNINGSWNSFNNSRTGCGFKWGGGGSNGTFSYNTYNNNPICGFAIQDNADRVTITNCNLSNNRGTPGDGGLNVSGWVTNLTVNDNTANNNVSGAGITLNGTGTLNRNTAQGNKINYQWWGTFSTSGNQ